MLPGDTRTAFRQISLGVKAYFEQQYRDEMQRYEDSGRDGDEPNRNQFINKCMRQAADNPRSNRDFDILTRSSCFPHAAVLRRDGIVDNDEFLVTRLQGIATAISRILHPDSLNQLPVAAVTALFRQSPFYAHRVKIREQSPKIAWVETYIRNLIAIRRAPRDSEEVLKRYGPAPPDNTNCRHALVLSDNPLSAYLSTMVLWDIFSREIESKTVIFLYAHSGISATGRAEYTRYMQQSCERTNIVKVLISTMDIFGVGHNLQRVNTAIITEVPSSHEKQKQAFGRVDRKGQTMTPLLYQLFDDENLAERVRMFRNKNRRFLANQGHDDDDAGDLEQLLPPDDLGV
ncbi:hypothetical protein ONZ43_g7558 [Nemania bipapillata]|uniref:Uncharacterized protein n=1 Tax=Nemania bipapillata TaxID=110536 RepID=A0ACC2HPX1_9PEZI|nr:hypothetical protein ONZ43_g7558 [Nemania bipapillata]